MKSCKLNAFFLNLLLSYISIFLSCQNEIKNEFNQIIDIDIGMDFILEPGKVQRKFIKDTNRNPFFFRDKGIYNDLLVNFYSLSCNIELSNYSSQNISSLKLNGSSISMRIKENSFQTANITMKEKPNFINGINKYENKKNCSLIINTIDVSNLSLLLEENEPTILYFDKNYLKKINLIYQREQDTNIKSHITLSFSFNDVSKFKIYIPDIINTIISNSTTIFLDQKKLDKLNVEKLKISIEQIENEY